MLNFNLKKRVFLDCTLVLKCHIHKTGIIYLIITSETDVVLKGMLLNIRFFGLLGRVDW